MDARAHGSVAKSFMDRLLALYLVKYSYRKRRESRAVSNRACYGAIRFIVAGAKFSAMTRITLRIDFDGSRALAGVVGANGVNLGSR